MSNNKKEAVNFKLVRKHDAFIIAAIFVAGVLIGSLTLGGMQITPFQLSGAAVTTSACRDGIDNDGDNKVDYPNDPGCSSKSDNSELNANVQCDDGIDNDGDTFRDYPKDTGCFSLTDKSERSSRNCDDGKDNDNDKKIDYPNDPGCSSPSDSTEHGSAQCDDGKDNDGDKLVDLKDPGCSDSTDNDEKDSTTSTPGAAECNNGHDDSTDADTLSDYPNDPGCSSPTDPFETDGQCDDKYDNDGDGYTDYPNDPECSSYSTYYEGNCVDSDGGINSIKASVQGTVLGTKAGAPYSYTDYCLTSNILKEYYCDGAVNSPFSVDVSCSASGGNGIDSSVCINGACTQPSSCGNGIIESGEECDDGNTISGDGCSSYCTKEQTCINQCGDGICQSIVCYGPTCACGENDRNCPSDCPKQSCYDSDGGRNYEIRGFTTDNINNGTDFCWNYGTTGGVYGPCQGSINGCVLVEHFCNSANELEKETYACPYGCSGGACKY